MFLAKVSGNFAAVGDKAKSAKFAAVFKKGVAAALAAGEAAVPQEMVVRDMNSGKVYRESEGLCGFAWVKVFPGNSPFANWLKKNGLAGKAYGGGVDIWISDFNQSVTRKEAAASALAKVLSVELGVTAYASSRLD